MNLTFEHHEEARFNQAVFDVLVAGLRHGHVPGVEFLDLHRVPGPVNSMFAVGLEVSRGGRVWTEEFSVTAWPALQDPSPHGQAEALLEQMRVRLADADPPADATRSRPWWRFRA
ncbi:MAG: hypothetical protein ACT4QF_11170 [Sporichthyaceae bacterium]